MATASNIIGYGVVGSRPTASAAITGNLYFGTDTGLLYRCNGSGWDSIANYAATPGTVTSVAATVPTGFAISGTPITTNGTFAITESTQAANKVKAGPTSGGAATPAYRALIADDLPAATVTAVGAVKSPWLFTATADKTVANTTTQTSLIGTGVGTLTLPANCLTAGRSVRIKLYGFYEARNNVDTLNFRAKLGSTVVTSTLLTDLDLSGSTNVYWELEAIITCRTVGVSGTVVGQIRMLHFADDPSANDTVFGTGNFTTNAVTVDTTGTLALDLTGEWSSAEVENTITSTNATVELLG